jgi:hypothetical protein
MRNPKSYALLATVILLSAMQLDGGDFETNLIRGAADFTWPHTQASAVQANKLPKATVESFLNSLRAQVPEYLPTRVARFRFVPMEKGRYYLVAVTGERFYWYADVVAPEGAGFRYSDTITWMAMEYVSW